MKKVINSIRENPNLEITSRNFGMLLYNMAKSEVDDIVIVDLIETQMVRLKGRMLPRHKFGAFYGALCLNYKPYIISFLEEEFL